MALQLLASKVIVKMKHMQLSISIYTSSKNQWEISLWRESHCYT